MQQQKPTRAEKAWLLAPLIGICLYILLYILAAFLYPGGSDTDKYEKGFNVLTNYWCDLLGQRSKNGEVNTARPFAMTAMAILCLSIFLFWYHIPKLFSTARQKYNITRFSGMISMIVPLFLSTEYHDMVINISGFFGVIAILFASAGLYNIRLYKLFSLGLICLLLVIVNNYIYHTGSCIQYLPVIQKLTFLLFLLWFSAVHIILYRRCAA